MASLFGRPVTKFFVILAFLCFILPAGAADPEESNDQKSKGTELDALTQRLVKDGFDREKIDALFLSESVFFNPSGVSLFFIHTESSLDYDQFLSQQSISRAETYMEDHKQALETAEKTFGVDKTAITAILLVETRLGTYLGKRAVLNTLATMAALTDKTLMERIWDSIPAGKKPNRDAFLKKVDQRSRWGYEELKALIRYTERESLSPEEIKGSYAGAMGIPQFMPSNALTLARDGNADGKVDLFDHNDAIFSVANFLKHHGWKPGISRQRQHEVLFRYNHSNYYVDTLLKISDRLKEG